MYFTPHKVRHKQSSHKEDKLCKSVESHYGKEVVSFNYGSLYFLTASLKRDIEIALAKASSQLSVGSTKNTSDASETFHIPVPTCGENERFAYASAALDLR
jgi:hypothetical protein